MLRVRGSVALGYKHSLPDWYAADGSPELKRNFTLELPLQCALQCKTAQRNIRLLE